VGFFIYIKKTLPIIYYKKQIIMEQNIMDAATQGFNLPHDIVTLPSGGKFYKNKKKSVKVGFLTASDENHLMNIKKADSQSIINALVRNKLYEPDLKPEAMLDGDIEAILIFLRNTSFGSEYEYSLVDPKTSNRFDVSVVIEEINIKKPIHEPDENGFFEAIINSNADVISATLILFPTTYAELLLDKLTVKVLEPIPIVVLVLDVRLYPIPVVP
jgi:hypothetical protein